MKILSNATWYDMQNQLAENKIEINYLRKEIERLDKIIENTGVTRDKNGRYVSTKKKER